MYIKYTPKSKRNATWHNGGDFQKAVLQVLKLCISTDQFIHQRETILKITQVTPVTQWHVICKDTITVY